MCRINTHRWSIIFVVILAVYRSTAPVGRWSIPGCTRLVHTNYTRGQPFSVSVFEIDSDRGAGTGRARDSFFSLCTCDQVYVYRRSARWYTYDTLYARRAAPAFHLLLLGDSSGRETREKKKNTTTTTLIDTANHLKHQVPVSRRVRNGFFF